MEVMRDNNTYLFTSIYYIRDYYLVRGNCDERRESMFLNNKDKNVILAIFMIIIIIIIILKM